MMHKTKAARKRGVALAATVLIAGGLLLSGGAPAMAWGSSSTGSSPANCWGGFAGSSSTYYDSSIGYQMMYASVGASGSGCWAWAGTQALSAYFRYSSSTAEYACSTTNFNGCNNTQVFKNGRVGANHNWGSVSFNT